MTPNGKAKLDEVTSLRSSFPPSGSEFAADNDNRQQATSSSVMHAMTNDDPFAPRRSKAVTLFTDQTQARSNTDIYLLQPWQHSTKLL